LELIITANKSVSHAFKQEEKHRDHQKEKLPAQTCQLRHETVNILKAISFVRKL